MTLYNLAKVYSSTTGSGTLTLGSAFPGYLTFAEAGVLNGTSVSYGIENGASHEVGVGVFNASGSTLTRNVIKSTNSGSPLVLVGTSFVYITALAEDIGNIRQYSAVADNTMARFDGTTGSYIQSGCAVLDDTGSIYLNTLKFTTSPCVVAQDGQLYWNANEKTLSLNSDISGSVTLDIGHEMFVRVVNKTGVQINDGQVVYVSGVQGNRPTAWLAIANNYDSSAIIGMATQNIPINEEGFVTVYGVVHGYDTRMFNPGDTLFVSGSVAGAVTNVDLVSPNLCVRVGLALNSTVNGSIFVKPEAPIVLDTSLSGSSSSHAAVSQSAITSFLSGSYVNKTGDTMSGCLVMSGSAKLIGTTQNFIDIYRFGFVTDYAGTQETTIAFDGTNTFSLSPNGSSWNYYRAGIKYNISGSKTVVLSASSPAPKGLYFIYIDSTNGTLISSSSVPWTLEDTKVPVATIAWDNSGSPKYWMSNERHTSAIDRRYHWEHHFSDGTEVITSPSLDGPVVAPSVPADTDNVFGISQAVVSDEDLKHTLSALTKPNGVANAYEVFYRASGSWFWTESPVPFKYGTYIQFDSSGSVIDTSGNKFVNTYLLLTNVSGSARFSTIPGQSEFSTLAAAQGELFSSLVRTGIPIGEYVAVYQFNWETSAAYTTKGKCRLASAPRPISVAASGASSGISTTWGSITGTITNQTDLAPYLYNFSSASPLNVASASSLGTSGSLSRSDHVHAHGNQTVGSLHSVVSTGSAGFVPALNGSGSYFLGSAGSWVSGSNIVAGAIGNYTSASFVKIAGDTMTGSLVLPLNGLSVGGSHISMSSGSIGFGIGLPTKMIDIRKLLGNNSIEMIGLTELGNSGSNGMFIGYTFANGAFGAYSGKVSVDRVGTSGDFNMSLNTMKASASRITLFLDAGGNIGINTITPGTVIAGSASSAYSAGNLLEINGGSNDPALFLRNANNDVGIDIWSDSSAGHGYIDSRFIGNTHKALNFRTNSAGSAINAMTILGSGSVGFGTSSPNRPLTIRTNTGNFGWSHGDGTVELASFVWNTSVPGGWLGTISNHKLHFFINNQNPSVTLNTNGFLGVGTTSPNKTLEVSGSLMATDYYSGDGSKGITTTITFTPSPGGPSLELDVRDGLIVGYSIVTP